MNDPIMHRRGRPKGTKRGPSKQVRDLIRRCIAEHFATGIRISKAATGTHYFRYANLYKEVAEEIWDEVREDHLLNVAQQLFPGLREKLIEFSRQASDFHDMPGKREIAKHYRENSEEHADNILIGLGCDFEYFYCDLTKRIEERLKRRIGNDKRNREYASALVRQELAKVMIELVHKLLETGPSGLFTGELLDK